MMDVFSQAAHALGMLLSSLQGGLADVAMKFFPFVLLLELPLFVLVCVGMIRFGLRRLRPAPKPDRYPSVSCLVTCYSEGKDVAKTIE